jgi:hypothetical protein
VRQTTTAAGHTSKHVGTSKHTSTTKHTPAKTLTSKTAAGKTKVTAVALPVVGAKAVGLSLGDVQCCAAEALAASLRLSGRPVADEDVLALYWHTASDEDAGASVMATLEAAWRFGLGGVRPRWKELDGTADLSGARPGELGYPARLRTDHHPDGHLGNRDLLILQVDLPGPHAVLATPDGWWSWGELHDPSQWPDAVVEEAWAIGWPQ